MDELILTDKLIQDWLEEIPNMEKVIRDYPVLPKFAMGAVLLVLNKSLLENLDNRKRIASLEARLAESLERNVKLEDELNDYRYTSMEG